MSTENIRPEGLPGGRPVEWVVRRTPRTVYPHSKTMASDLVAN